MSTPRRTGVDPRGLTDERPVDPGIRVRRSDVHDVDVMIRNPETGPRANRALLDAGLDEWLLDALREFPGDDRAECRTTLSEAGADALDGAWTRVAADAASALVYAEDTGVELNPDDLQDGRMEGSAVEAIETAIATARSIGTSGTPLGVPSSRADLTRGLPPIFNWTTSTTPRIVVELTGEWFERQRQQREDVLELLLALAPGCDVVLVPKRIAARQLYELHREDLPAHVTARLDPGRPAPAHVRGEEPARVLEVVREAREALDPDSTRAEVLKALSDSLSESMTYSDLRRELCLRGSEPRVAAHRLEELDLVERLPRGEEGRTVVSLRPAGQRLVEEWDATVGRQSRLSDAAAAEPRGSSEEALRPPQNRPTMPCEPARGRGVPPDETTERASPADPDTAGDRTDDYAHGAVPLEWMNAARHAAVVGAARSGEVSLCNAELVPALEACGDGRVPAWSFDHRDAVLVTGCDYHNPLQAWVSTARALASPRTWNRVLTEDRVGSELERLAANDKELLRAARCVGWLPDEATENYEELRDSFQEAYEELLELTQRLNAEDYEDRDAFRGEVLRFALGLAGSMSHLLDLADVEVVREFRIPEFTDKFSRGSHADRRRDLCRTIAMGAAIQSSYGHFSAFRQLLEDRPEKVGQALEPSIDASNPLAELHGSIVIAGHGVEDLEDEIRRMLERPRELRPDAPEIAVKIPVRLADTPMSTRRVAKWMGRQKRLDIPRKAWVALHGFCRSPYAAADALANLEREELRRELFLDELRVAIGRLDSDRLLPDATRAARAGLLALLRAEEPLSQAELARRADISTQSWRNHREALQVAGLVEETAAGWRCTLPFANERYEDDLEVAEPWILDVETERLPGGARTRTQEDVLCEVAAELGELDNPVVDDSLMWPPWDGPPPNAVLEAIGAGILTRFVEAHPEQREQDPPAALLGPKLEQASLEELAS